MDVNAINGFGYANLNFIKNNPKMRLMDNITFGNLCF